MSFDVNGDKLWPFRVTNVKHKFYKKARVFYKHVDRYNDLYLPR